MIPRHPVHGFALPRIWTPTGGTDPSMARACIDWVASAACPLPPMLPWQEFLTLQALALRPADGDGPRRLAHGQVVLRVSRQQGKTTWARAVLLFLLRHGKQWLGDTQRILNTHPDGKQAVELMKPVAHMLGYGRAHGGRATLESQTFMSSWYPWGPVGDDQPVWMSRAMTVAALTGQKGITAALVDELQDARPGPVREALGGSMSGARTLNRLRLFAGTGAKPGSVYLDRLKRQIGQPGVLWAEWSVPPGTDEGDEQLWEWASPDWSEPRLEYLREERAGSEADEFRRNYLLNDEVTVREPGLVDRDGWAASAVPGMVRPADRVVFGVGLDAAADSYPVVAAWVHGDGVAVSLLGVHDGLEGAVGMVESLRGAACRLVLSPHLRGQVQVRGLREVFASNEAEAVQALELGWRRVAAGQLTHPAEDLDLSAAVLDLPAARVRGRWDAGTLAMVAALAASKPQQRAAAG